MKGSVTYDPTVGIRVEGMGVGTRVGGTVGVPVVGTAVGRLVGRDEGAGEGLVVGGEEQGHVRT
jgi:hypothetical protein